MVPLLSIIVAFVIRTAALYIAFVRTGFWRLSTSEILLFASISTVLSIIIPVTSFLDVSGLLFRVALFCVMLILLMRLDLFEAVGVVVVAAIIQGIIVLVLGFTPFNFLVAGLTPWTIP